MTIKYPNAYDYEKQRLQLSEERITIMKCVLSIQEKLKDLRIEKGLSLEELAKETGLSKSALGSYESDDYKDISHKAIITLAKYYGVSSDYLLGLTENIEEGSSTISDLKLDDDTVNVLKSGTINNRLLCEIIKHPDFWKFMSDTEIYIDSLAEMQIRNLNSFVSLMRSKIQLRDQIPDSEHYIRTLKLTKMIISADCSAKTLLQLQKI